MTDWALIGELALTRGPVTCRDGHELHVEWIRVDHADPVVFISRDLLAGMLTYGSGPHADLKPGPGVAEVAMPASREPADLAVWFGTVASNLEGWLLTVRGVNRTVLYRIGGKVATHDGYLAEWPD